mgnify:CR=1 FL=1
MKKAPPAGGAFFLSVGQTRQPPSQQTAVSAIGYGLLGCSSNVAPLSMNKLAVAAPIAPAASAALV